MALYLCSMKPHIKILRKPEIPHILRNCMYQNIPLGDNRDSTKDHSEVGMVVLLIEEILLNYYGIESREGIKTLKTSFRMPRDILF